MANATRRQRVFLGLAAAALAVRATFAPDAAPPKPREQAQVSTEDQTPSAPKITAARRNPPELPRHRDEPPLLPAREQADILDALRQRKAVEEARHARSRPAGTG